LARLPADEFRAAVLGLVSFSGQIPALLLTPFAGVWVDRWGSPNGAQGDAGSGHDPILCFGSSGLSGNVNIWHILGLSMFQGSSCVRHSSASDFVVEMIEDRADLPNAIALTLR